ncbi:hypothetical protein WJX81_005292 [Elliptochloris bilobata]|uniref:L-ascorbate peroxidase n=1 Tax=Elliptochloris bilobata TaxID=381761 RepID=A0AAW1REW9_9CHLO
MLDNAAQRLPGALLPASMCPLTGSKVEYAWAHEAAAAQGDGRGRALLDTKSDIASTLINSTLWLEADVRSLTGYAMRTLPTSIQDARSSVNGEMVDPLDRFATVGLQQLADIPGTVRYFLRSAPEMLEQALAINWNDFAKQLDLFGLDPIYLRIFKVLFFVTQPSITGPLYVRLAFHDAATWNKKATNKGGANGSIRHEFDWPSNGGLQRFAWPLLYTAKQVVDKVVPHPVSWADLCQIAGAVGVYTLHGPVINVGYCRPDVDKADEFGGVGSNTNDQRDYPAKELIAEWERYGFMPYDLVILSGGHSFGLTVSTNPQGFMTPVNRVFNNKYYKNILLGNAFFQSDRALGEDPRTKPYVEAFAANNDMFFANFTHAYQQLSWLGVDPSVKRLGLGHIEEYHG